MADFLKEQAPDGILESSEVSRMHRVDSQVLDLETRASEEVRRLLPLPSTSCEVLLVGDQGLPVSGIGLEVVIAQRS